MPRHDMVITPHQTNRLSTEQGLTLLEMMIALVILAIGLLALSGMQLTTIKANSAGFSSTTAVSQADQRIQQLKRVASFSDPLLTAGTHDINSIPSEADVTGGDGVTYHGKYTVTDDNPIVGVKLITYTVSWTNVSAANTINHSVRLITRMKDPALVKDYPQDP
jgi:type IV pilus assembly protein PilV